MQSAKNTKCEQYLYCHFSEKILDLDGKWIELLNDDLHSKCLDELKSELSKRFEERGITDQLVIEKSKKNLMQVIWRKKRLEAFLEEGKLHKDERMVIIN